MKNIRVLGVDPALGAFGLSLVEFTIMDGEVIESEILDAGGFETKKGQFNAMASFDNFARGAFLARKVQEILRERTHTPIIAAVEVPGGSKNATTSLKLGIAMGAVSGALEAERLPVVTLTPQALKIRIANSATATKKAIEERVLATGIRGCARISSISPARLREHVWDATAAAIAATEDPTFRLIAQDRK